MNGRERWKKDTCLNKCDIGVEIFSQQQDLKTVPAVGPKTCQVLKGDIFVVCFLKFTLIICSHFYFSCTTVRRPLNFLHCATGFVKVAIYPCFICILYHVLKFQLFLNINLTALQVIFLLEGNFT